MLFRHKVVIMLVLFINLLLKQSGGFSKTEQKMKLAIKKADTKTVPAFIFTYNNYFDSLSGLSVISSLTEVARPAIP